MKINGQRIIAFHPIGSMYHNNCVQVEVAPEKEGDESLWFKIDVGEFLKLINGIDFDVEEKRVHNYLTVAEEG